MPVQPTLSSPSFTDFDPSISLSELLPVFRGMRNGVYYGGKVRLMHSIVMAVTFGNKPLPQTLRIIIKNTVSHAFKLGGYVGLYKFLILVLTKIQGRPCSFHTFMAGMLAGYLVFGKRQSSLN